MPSMSKGRATGYGDYYKGNNRTPGGFYDDEEEGKPQGFSISITTGTSKDSDDRLRKEALKRRLARRKKAGMQ
jgi:hypothetical protein